MTGRVVNATMGIVVAIALVGVWWVASAGSTSFYFPPLETILKTFGSMWTSGVFPRNLVPSLTAIVLGLGISIVLGIGVGVALGLSAFWSETVGPVLQFLRYLPAVALLPLAIQIMGIGLEMRVTIIVLGALWPILLNTVDGVRGVHPAVLDVAKAARISPTDRITRVILPAASPQIFSGIRASLAVAVILMVASELLGSTAGMGYLILEAQRQFSIPEMWAGMILLGIVGYLLNVIFGLVEHVVLAWHRESRI